METPIWYKNAIFYEVNVRAFRDSNGDGRGDLRGLLGKLDYLKMLGVDCIWTLPMYPSPLFDGGYDISDFRGILPEFGTLDDFKALIQAVHERGMRLITDLVMNHTSDQHPWFQAARSDPHSPYRDYYVWSDSPSKYPDARIIFVDSQPSNWSWDEQAGQFYWHRFYACQPDLNYDNPAVQAEMLAILHYWLELGIDGFRADAVPYLFERDGTNCENLPETHAFLKRVRAYIDQHFPGKILLCEANQWPEDVRPYFGEGNEFQMGFHFPVMPRIFMALKQGRRAPIEWILKRTPAIPQDCQWCTFLRNHDELTLEMVTEEERQWMWKEYAPEPRMRLNLGIRRRLAPLLDNDRRKIELANSLLFTLPGSPIVYYGDEIGMGDKIELNDRDGVRTPMQWDGSPTGGFSSGGDPSHFYLPVIGEAPYDPVHVNVADQIEDPGSLLNTIRDMIRVRKQHPVFALGNLEWVDSASDAVAAFWRRAGNEAVLVLNNLADAGQDVSIALPAGGWFQPVDLMTGRAIELGKDDILKLKFGCVRIPLDRAEIGGMKAVEKQAEYWQTSKFAKEDFTISTDRNRMDVDTIHGYLSRDSYWAKNIPRAIVERSIQNSLCFGVFDGGRQVGFARVITDFATFAYLADVFILPEYRGRGLSKWLVESIRAHPDLQGLRNWLLFTLDAHGLYAKFGFEPTAHPERIMQIRMKNPYG